MSQISFKGKRILVTGGSKGIGRCVCKYLHELDAHVIALGRSQEDLDSLQEELGEERCTILKCDLGKEEETRNVIKENVPIHGLVNNAAIAKLDSFIELKTEDFSNILNINLLAAFYVAQEVAKDMISRKEGGSIVNVSSQASLTALPLHTAYCSAKGGLDQLTRVMALELGQHQIRVNCVNPTVVLTDMGKLAWSDEAKARPMLEGIPLGKFANPIDVAHSISFLLSDHSAMINGVMLPIDGGFLAGGLPMTNNNNNDNS
eukprot:TRINITY_DN8623_c0_g1_i1.p1 TRINITY_DN8623_c0_g1~~TRINITY_DN8623_c0_g1_i1.p1  ORF type:complete len:261 (+),score=104.42 TRINITY_DN8623_c0_g1_i1:57-839(+)